MYAEVNLFLQEHHLLKEQSYPYLCLRHTWIRKPDLQNEPNKKKKKQNQLKKNVTNHKSVKLPYLVHEQMLAHHRHR